MSESLPARIYCSLWPRNERGMEMKGTKEKYGGLLKSLIKCILVIIDHVYSFCAFFIPLTLIFDFWIVIERKIHFCLCFVCSSIL